MKILHIIEGIAKSAGTTVFAVELSGAQVAAGHKVYLECFKGVECAIPQCVTLLNVKSLDAIGVVPDIVHIHSLWSFCNVYAMRWCQKKGYKFVVSIHGCLMPRVFAKSPLKKWVFYWLFLKRNIKKAGAIHCTSEYEKQVCEKLGFKGPFVVAPLGVDMPASVERRRDKACRTLLFMGRLGEEKGLVNLLDAWKTLLRDGWRLVLAGPDWLGYKKILDDKIADESIDGVEFIGAVYGADKEALYRLADVFVLPSPMENFSMVVLEALSYGVPTIATKGTPWSELVEHKCGWWIDQGVEALKRALQSAMSIDDVTRHDMGERGRNLAQKKYSWASIATDVLDCYNAVIKSCCRVSRESGEAGCAG